MIKLSTKLNVTPPTIRYPYGQIIDDDGTGNGTPVTKDVYQDHHSFFEKLMVDAGLTPNGLFDNAYDGFQLNAALAAIIAAEITPFGKSESTINTDSGGIGVTTLTIPIPTNTIKEIEVTIVSKWVSGSAGVGNGGSSRKLYTYKNVSGTVSLVGAATDIHTRTTGASVPAQSLTVVGTNVLVNAQAGSGEVYSVRTVAFVK